MQTLVGHSASTVYGLAATADGKCVVTGISVVCHTSLPSFFFKYKCSRVHHECRSLTGCRTRYLFFLVNKMAIASLRFRSICEYDLDNLLGKTLIFTKNN